MPFHMGVDAVLLGQMGLLECQTEPCQPLGITACFVQSPGWCRCRAMLAQPSPQTFGAVSAPAKGEAAVGSCTVLVLQDYREDYRGETAEITRELQSAFVLLARAVTEE